MNPTLGPRRKLVLLVDVANVMGSRPDGWWRDRAGAASGLMASLAPLAGAVVLTPDGEAASLSRIVAVIEGKARSASAPLTPPGQPALEVIVAPADGDTTIVATAQNVLAGAEVPLVVTADRGLRDRLPAGTRIAGPRWLLDLI